MASVEHDLAPGDLFAGRFAIDSRLGRGGFAVVYRAHDRLVRRDVALKILRRDRTDETSIRRLRREAAVVRDVSSPHLVRIFDTDTHEGAAYLVLEYLPGGTLSDRLAGGPLPVEQVVTLAAELLAALEALHARGLVHRDVKPSNVLFDGEGAARLGDFGLAQVSDGDLTRSVAGAELLGTARYLSPEQALGEPLGPSSDLFSLGLVVFEALTGQSPFPAAEATASVLVRLTRPARAVRSLRADVPRWLDRWVGCLLQRQPSDRYQSTQVALADLRARRGPRRYARILGRSPRAGAQRVVSLPLLGVGVLITALAAWWLLREQLSTGRFARYESLEHKVDRVVGIDQRGGVLWERTGAHAFGSRSSALARLGGGGSQIVAVVGGARARRALTIIDPGTGATVRTVELGDATARRARSSPDRFKPLQLDALDLDGDGLDEVLVTFVHETEAPSFTMLWEPRLDRVRPVLLAAGHMTFAGHHDLDGDGTDELFFNGYNSMLCGRYPAFAAVRLEVPINDEPHRGRGFSGAVTPGLGELLAGDDGARVSRFLALYRLLPRGGVNLRNTLPDGTATVEVLPTQRRLRVGYLDGRRAELSFDEDAPSEISPESPWSRRLTIFELIEEARRLQTWQPETAPATARRAREVARTLDDPTLKECADRVETELLIAVGRVAEAEQQLLPLVADEVATSEIAYTTAAAYHLQGRLEDAVRWYRRGLGPGGGSGPGSRQRIYYLEGLVLALLELGRADEAERAALAYRDGFADFERADLFVDLARWRQGLRPSDAQYEPRPGQIDSVRYLALQRRYLQEGPSDDLLKRVSAEIELASETKGVVRSLAAEIIAARGQLADALDAVRRGVAELEQLRSTNPVARGFLPLAQERRDRIERLATGMERAR